MSSPRSGVYRDGNRGRAFLGAPIARLTLGGGGDRPAVSRAVDLLRGVLRGRRVRYAPGDRESRQRAAGGR
jgi:hypothetical protein